LPETKTYRPLPDPLAIAASGIDGLGIFAKEKVEEGRNFGMSHLQFGSEIIRTPLGGFINHSDNPNCEKVELHFTNVDNHKMPFDFKKWNLIALRDIRSGEELTVKYGWYKV
jgi:SET domain-containing protein